MDGGLCIIFRKVLKKGLAQLQEPPQHESGRSVQDWRPCQFPASSPSTLYSLWSSLSQLSLKIKHFDVFRVVCVALLERYGLT